MNGMHVSGACPWCGQTDPSKAGRHPTGGRCNNPWHADHPEHRPNVRPISGTLHRYLCERGHTSLSSNPDYEVCTAALTPDGGPLVTNTRVPDHYSIRCGARVLDDDEVHDLARRQLDVSAVSGGGPNWEEMIDQRDAEIERLRAEIERLVERDSKRQELLDELNRHMAGCPYAHNEWWCMCPPDQPDPECIYEHS